jgi:pyruvate,water dikinase
MSYLLWYNELCITDINIAGGKNASLGEMYTNLSKCDINIPNGFILTTNLFDYYIQYNNLSSKIDNLINKLDINNINQLKEAGIEIRQIIENGEFPDNISEEISNNYKTLSNMYNVDTVDVAVRSSSTAEDLHDASFAGQQDTYLNINSLPDLIISIKKFYASLYNDRAISYRKEMNYTGNLSISVGIQKMVRSDMHSSGVAFSIDPDSGFNKVVVINAIWGLGELLVQGNIIPDEYLVFKPTLKEGNRSIIDKKIGNKTHKIVYDNKSIKTIENSEIKQKSFCLNDDQIIKLGEWVCKIEEYYSTIYNKYTPIDIEWAVDGLTNNLYIVQARPETVQSRKDNTMLYEYNINPDKPAIINGIAVGDKITNGKVCVMSSINDNFDGDILVADITDPDWEPIMKKAKGIITNRGARTCHCSIIAREMQIPAVVGCINATSILKNGDIVTISCAEGEIGYIYDGIIPYKTTELSLNEIPEVKTNIMLNIANPNTVFKYWKYPVKGIGLVREEFIINNFIQAHPLSLIEYDNLEIELKNKIAELIVGYNSPTEYYINKLVYGLSRIACTYYPLDVIVRFSDFKSNEYSNLLGGNKYEPVEENPMIGWRGASRYYSDSFIEAFGLECKAIKIAREVIGLHNIIVMVPFCRTPEELLNVYSIMERYGLVRGENGLKVYIMCEVPSNVILAEEFCKLVDGFSIGSNDLTQLTLGLDRDSPLVSHIFDERNPAVKKMIEMAIDICKRNNKKIGICGQGPSDFPDFAQFLVSKNIDSISLTPDSIFKVISAISQI